MKEKIRNIGFLLIIFMVSITDIDAGCPIGNTYAVCTVSTTDNKTYEGILPFTTSDYSNYYSYGIFLEGWFNGVELFFDFDLRGFKILKENERYHFEYYKVSKYVLSDSGAITFDPLSIDTFICGGFDVLPTVFFCEVNKIDKLNDASPKISESGGKKILTPSSHGQAVSYELKKKLKIYTEFELSPKEFNIF